MKVLRYYDTGTYVKCFCRLWGDIKEVGSILEEVKGKLTNSLGGSWSFYRGCS
jgi:hypothetical protein